MNTINWEDSSWKHKFLIDEEVLSLLHTKIQVFSCSVSCLGKMNENTKIGVVQINTGIHWTEYQILSGRTS